MAVTAIHVSWQQQNITLIRFDIRQTQSNGPARVDIVVFGVNCIALHIIEQDSSHPTSEFFSFQPQMISF